MEPRARAEEQVIHDSTRFRWRLVAACMLLTGLAMTQSPGLLVPDTKLDLAVAPLDFLSRAAHLWDGEGAFGQLQNQAYGYLWPMGPFFALGTLLDVPGWVVQRLWMALVLCVAFVGTAKLARVLGVRSDLACILGALAYALSPRMVTVVGPSSIEVWPMALAPWVLLPLVIGTERGSARQAAALSALAIAMVGGVNAAATSAVLPLGVLWLLTRSRGTRRRTMMLWWPVFTLLAALWWLVPLFLLGSYSPPFLDFIESAGITTIPTDLADTLRGTSNWVPFVDGTSRAGNDLVRQNHLALNSAFVLVAGVLGLALRRTPHRLFLVSGVVVGLFLVSMGHTGAVQGFFAPTIQHLLDGTLAPLRNVHKFDPVLRLPLVIGLAWLVDWLVDLARDARTPRAERANFRFLAGLVGFAVLAAATPAAAGRITPAGGFEEVPDYWIDAANWLAEDGGDGVALLAPGTMFGAYVWGAARDEPFQPLASTPWAVRNAVPLAPAGNIRMLDAIEDRLAQGHGSAGLADYLRRSGVSHVVVRNDLTRDDDHPDPVLIHQALDQSPGIELAETFGPAVGGGAHLDGELGRALVNGGWQNDYAAIEIYAVSPPPSAGTASAEPPVVVGGSEDLLDLADLRVLGDAPTRLAANLGADQAADGPVILTDGNQSVYRHFGRVHDATSPVRTREQAESSEETVPDYVLPDATRWSTYADYVGVEDVRASSSLSDASASPSSLGRMPFAALDGNASTSWQSTRFADDAHWWQVDLANGALPGAIEVTGGLIGDQEVVVSTDDWTSDPVVLVPDAPTEVAVEDTASGWLRITDASGRASTPLNLAEVELPGIVARRLLDLPQLPDGSGAPDAIVLRALSDARTGCAVVDLDVRCIQGREAAPEEPRGMDRRLTLPAAASYGVSVQARAVPGPALDALVQEGMFTAVQASSTGVADARASALAAVDGDDATTWSADLSDVRPSLDLRWLRPQTMDSITVRVDPNAAARAPELLRLRWPDGQRIVALDEEGSASFRRVRTDKLSIDVEEAEPATSVDYNGATSPVPVGITELEIGGARGLPMRPSDESVELPCGTGPDLVFNGTVIRTRVTASGRDLVGAVSLPATPCGASTVALRDGENLVSARASDVFTPESVVLHQGRLPIGEGTAVTGSSDGIGGARLEPSAGDTLVAGHQNSNPGWSATQGGDRVTPTVVDGWRQGWAVSGQAEPVVASFAPGTTYRWSLAAGAVAFLGLVLAVLLGLRRRSSAQAPPLAERTLGPWLLLGLVPVVALALAGAPGAVVGTVAAAVVVAAHRLEPALARGLVAFLVVPAISAFAFLPWGGLDGWAGNLRWPAYLVVGVVSGLLAVLAADCPSRTRYFNRSAGSSTNL